MRGRVATDVYNAVGLGKEEGVDDILVHSGAWWVGDDDVGTSVAFDEVAVEDVFHVAGKEEGVVDVVDLRVDLSIVDGFGHVFDADDLTCLTTDEIGNGAGAGIEVVDEFVAGEACEIASNTIEGVGLVGVGLIEALRAYLEAEVFHLFVDMVGAVMADDILVANGVVALMVVDIEQ